MDEIIYLEPDEEITSVIDKLTKSETESVGLVIPRNSGLIHSIVNLKLLKKEAANQGKDIALVTGDKIGKNIAAQVGIPVFEDVHSKKPVSARAMPDRPKGDDVIEVDMSDGEETSEKSKPVVKQYKTSVSAVRGGTKKSAKDDVEVIEAAATDDEADTEEAETEEDHMATHAAAASSAYRYSSVKNNHDEPPMKQDRYSAKRGSKPSNKKAKIVFVSILILLIAGTLLGLPQTSINVTVAAEPFEKDLKLTVDQSAKEASAENNTVPGKLLEQTNDEAQRVVSTGKKDVGTKAKGSVTFTNAWSSSEVSLEAGRVITNSDGKTFTLNDRVTIPGGTAVLKEGQVVTVAGTATGNVTATEPGDSYNVKPGRFSISGIPSERQDKIYAESSKDFTGGQTKQVNVMTQSDIDNAKKTIADGLNSNALDKLKTEAKDQKVLEEAITHEIVTVETNPKEADSETDYFDIKVTAKHKVMVFDPNQVNDMLTTLLKKELPTDKELLLNDGDQFAVKAGESDYKAGKLTLDSDIKTRIGSRVDVGQVKNKIKGKSQSAVQSEVRNMPNVKDVSVSAFPSWWWQATSFFPWNTRVKVTYE